MLQYWFVAIGPVSVLIHSACHYLQLDATDLISCQSDLDLFVTEHDYFKDNIFICRATSRSVASISKEQRGGSISDKRQPFMVSVNEYLKKKV